MIIVVNDPAGICKKEEVPIHEGMKLFEWIIETYGKNGFHVPTKIFRDRVSPDHEIDLADHLYDGCPLGVDDNIIVMHTPQGIGAIFAVGLFLGFAAVAFAPRVQALVPPPAIPEAKSANESPNNSLSGQTNIARPLQRIPDIFGKNLVFPDLITEPYFEFIDHVKVQFEFMCVGRGEYFVEEEKTGDTLLQNIDDTESTIFPPFTSPSELLNVTESNEVNGQNLFGENVEKLDINKALVGYTNTTTMVGTDNILSAFSDMVAGDDFELSISNPQTTLSIAMDFSGDTITRIAEFDDFEVGDPVTVISGGANSGNYILSAVSEDSISCVDDVTGVAVTFVTETGSTTTVGTVAFQGLGPYTFSTYAELSLGGGVIQYTITVSAGPNFAVTFDHNTKITTTNVFADNTIGPFNVPGNPDDIWIDIQAPKGLQDSGADLKIKFNLILQQVTSGGAPIGGSEESVISLKDNTRDPRFYTIKTTPATLGSFYTVSLKRLTDTDDDIAVSERTIWTRLAGVEDQTVTNFGDVTTWFVKTTATEQAVKIQERQFNAIVTRKLPTFDRTSKTMLGEAASGEHDAGTSATVMEDSGASFTVDEFVSNVIRNLTDGCQGVVTSNTATTVTVAELFDGTDNDWDNGDTYSINSPTARVADSVVQMIVDPKSGNKAVSQIDLEGLYDIQDVLDVDAIYGDALGRFCYSFSNANTPVNDEINTALKACRMFKFQEGNVVNFGRDQSNPVRSTLFSRRVKKPDSEKKTIKQFKLNDFDGVRLEWTDEITGDGETIIFPESPSPSPLNPQRIQAAGIKNYDQAWNMASFEFNKLIHRRTSVSTVVLRDGLLVSPNSRVGNVDSTTLSTQDGEIIGINGNTVETSEAVEFGVFPLGTVILRSENGDAETPIICAPRSDGINGFILAVLPADPIRLRGEIDNYQMGTLYDFAPDAIHTDTDYLVQEVAPTDDGFVNLTLINYTEAEYDQDTETPTPRP